MSFSLSSALQRLFPGVSDDLPPAEDVFAIRLNIRLLRWLLIVDAIVISLHIVTGALMPRIPERLNIAYDYSLGEYVSYVKFAAVVVILLVLFVRHRIPLLLSFAAIFAVVLADDSLMLHERGGEWLTLRLGFSGAGGLKGQDYGEMTVWAGLALALVPLLIWGFVASAASDRVIGYRLILLMGILGVFAVVVDLIHPIFASVHGITQAFDLVEDGGEIVMASIILAHVVTLLRPGAIAGPKPGAQG